ncbi:hypothetical protein NKI25_31905 [Mesorhizobium sp. M0808]|uniref:hypothetical protein n=1 Tax=unclassified Mesorhizobium TaxID=325217 RepID=UPI00333A7EFB
MAETGYAAGDASDYPHRRQAYCPEWICRDSVRDAESRMRDKTSSSEAAWQEVSFLLRPFPTSVWLVGCDGCWIRCQLRRASQSGGLRRLGAAKAAYRFFDNPRVTEHSVLAGHFAATAARVAASEGPILILQDTTEFTTAALTLAPSFIQS